jgi:peptidoglycan/LPS O-acetylase OafA/YrhL
MIYRREIDGLRAVAVVPVILFHAGMSLFSGGYVGVDIFFVISGYLITSILINELDQGNFSIARFYERRARRILPALFFVMLCCIPFAWIWMLPSELKDFSESIIAVVFFSSNIFFWFEEGYFAPAAELKPLLHTWSLAVEEQYYMFFPIFLMFAWRFGRNRVFWSICLIAIISLLASEWGWRNKPNANFYLAPTRAWELLAGSTCAFWLSGREQQSSNLLSFGGLALIVFAIFYYDDLTPFPSAYALAPVLGAALIILFGGAGTWTANLLSMRGFVGVGLISYSAYLWHQPLFAFARIRSIYEPSPYLMAALVVLSLVLAFLSWRYIERPFRRSRSSILPTRSAVFTIGGAVSAIFVIGGFVGYSQDGFQQRFKSLNLKGDVGHVAFHQYIDDRFVDCQPKEVAKEAFSWEGFLRCKQSKVGDADIILLGDSHAEHLFIGLAENTKKNVAFYIKSSVPSISNPDFKKINNYIFTKSDAKIVVVALHYSRIDTLEHYTNYKNQFLALVKKIQKSGKKVILAKDVPSFSIAPEDCVFFLSILEARLNCKGSRASFLKNSKYYNNFVNYVSEKSGAPIFDPLNEICEKEICSMIIENEILYRDKNHLNIIGSKKVGKELLNLIITVSH